MATLAALTLLATSFVLGSPNAQTPAYGLVEAGFVDGVRIYSSGWPALHIDPATQKVAIGDALEEMNLDVATRRAYAGIESGGCGHSPYTTSFRAYDLDTTSILWESVKDCGHIPYVTSGAELVTVGSYWLSRYDLASGNKTGTTNLLRNTGNWARLVDFDAAGAVFFVDNDQFIPSSYPQSLKSRIVEKLDLGTGASIAAGSAMLADPCGGALNPATNTLYIVDEQPGRLVAVNATTLSETASVDVAPYIGLRHRLMGGCKVVVNPESNRVYVIRMEPQLDFSNLADEQRRGGKAYLVSIDAETMTVIQEVEIANTTSNQSLTVDPRTGKVYVYAPTENNPNRVQVFSDSSPETLIGDLQTGRYTQWFFAEGNTRSGYRMWLTLFSPDQPNKVRISFLTAQGQAGPFFKEVDLPANTRVNIDVNRELGAGFDVSTRIVSVWGKPFYAERPIYYAGGEAFSEGGNLGAGQHN